VNRDSKASTGRGRIDTGMTSLISAFLLPGFKLDGGKTSSGKQVDDKGSGRSLLGPHGPTLSVDGLSTLQFPDVEPMGHSSVFWRMWKACSGHSSVFHGWTFWTVFHGWTWLDTLQFFDMVPSVWRQSSRSGHFSWEQRSGHSSDSSQTSKKQASGNQNSWDSASDISETEPGIYRATWV